MFLEYTDRNIGVFIQKTGLSIVMYDQWIRMTGIGKCHDSGIDIYNPDKDRGVYIVSASSHICLLIRLQICAVEVLLLAI